MKEFPASEFLQFVALLRHLHTLDNTLLAMFCSSMPAEIAKFPL